MTFKDTFMGYSTEERQKISESAGLSLGYITKHMYVSGGEPKFRFDNAVSLDKASKGALSFLDHTEGSVDWNYVRRTLNRARREGRI